MKTTRRKFLKTLGSAAVLATFGKAALSSPENNQEKTRMKITYPPTMAALPLVRGIQRDFFLEDNSKNPFNKRGIDLELIPSNGPSEAARLVSGERADCGITDISSSIYGIYGTGNLKITSTAFEPAPYQRHWGLLTSSYYKIDSLEDLFENWLDRSERKSIVLSMRGIEHFLADELLTGSNFTVKDELHYLNQENLISRMTGLLNGNFVSAMMPEPLMTLALDNPKFEGYQANLLKAYKDGPLPPFVFVFNETFLGKSPELLEGFYAGWRESLEKTNDTDNYTLLELTAEIISQTLPGLRDTIERAELTEAFADLFMVPEFLPPSQLDEEIYSSVSNWMIEKGFLQEEIPYQRSFYPSVDLTGGGK